ncbi:Protein ral2 [Psilocybe cubensis]|uniref:Protein ral2 n=1 Tax=Psilocybe cubensis TaxID=181762 RepID=A0ACB8GZ85_PSICU|nr:Protein ral2 [Psilocybe cubensis]KAH9480536.1 Protein ral2 [Psilocybe cubensis]
MLHSIYDLTTFCRKTTGDVPAKLVGASTTVVGSKMYLFGGRLVTERRMVSDLYVFDLETFVWEQIPMYPDDDVPRARYFHSADTWNNHLVVFGGMSNQLDSSNPDELCVLNDVRLYNLSTRRWLPSPPPPPEPDPLLPRARYAHLSSVTADRLFVIGGQDFYNTWLDDVCVFDLVTKTWVQKRDYPRHCGTYRSVAVSSNTTVRFPQEEMQASLSSSLEASGRRFKPSKSTASPSDDVTPPEAMTHLAYSVEPTEDHPSDIYLYSNYNFTDVKRELEVFSPLPDTDFTIQDRSSSMTGTTSPPGLRFPTGAILGTHLIIAGTYLAHSYQSFSIWVLDLTSMTWSRIDPGKAIETGSWFRGCLWADANKFLIFGNRHGNLVDDYNRRLLSWDHVAVVDLEAFGIYQPPPLKLDVRMQELGLAALEERVLTDFEVVCDDGVRIPCSRRILEDRWPWFKEQRKQFLRKATTTLESLPTSSMHLPLPEVAGDGVLDEPRVDPRLTPRAFHLSEPYAVTMALLQYFYSLALITPLQHTPAVLSQLLILATNYRIPHLESLVKHAMHRSLSNSTSVGVYEVATLCSCRSLQIRALKTVMSYTQKRPSRRTEKENGGSSRPSDSGGDGGNGSSSKYVSRPRGTSDAKWSTIADRGGGSSSSYNTMQELPTNEQAPSTIVVNMNVNVGTSPADLQPLRHHSSRPRLSSVADATSTAPGHHHRPSVSYINRSSSLPNEASSPLTPKTSSNSIGRSYIDYQNSATSDSDANNTTDDEYHINRKSSTPKLHGMTPVVWPKKAPNVRWIAPAELNGQTAPPPHFEPAPNSQLSISTSSVSNTASPSSTTSTSSAFARFLGHHEITRKKSQTDDSQVPNAFSTGQRSQSALDQLKSQILEMEEERKRSKKESHIHALVDQAGKPLTLSGAMTM